MKTVCILHSASNILSLVNKITIINKENERLCRRLQGQTETLRKGDKGGGGKNASTSKCQHDR